MRQAPPRVLALNGGSSSIKFALFEVSVSLQAVRRGGIEGIGRPDATFWVRGLPHHDKSSRPVPASTGATAVGLIMDWLEERDRGESLTAVGHRVVQSGPRLSKPERLTAPMLEELHGLTPLDPEHLPNELLLAEAISRRFPDVPQVACFDTAFHHDMPRVAQLLPIPRRFEAMGVRRYGFHGLSYQFLIEELERVCGAEVARGRVILAHLGNGASLAAVRDSKSVDTSMGLTATSGVPMSTRSGDLDPGLVGYLARAEAMSARHHIAIARETAKQLGLGSHILDANELGDPKQDATPQAAASLEEADGFAQVFPEHKFHIGEVLQKRGHIVGKTGDGVNDAPALKKADCGIAVSGATDAARAAASIVLLAPGLSVIVDAIKESRKIFQRMNSYAMYRIAETLRVLLFMTAAILGFNFYPVTAVMIVMLALLNDGAILC